MTAVSHPSARALHLLGITFSMGVLAYALNSVVEVLLQERMRVQPVPAAARPATALDPHRLASLLGLSVPVSPPPRWASCDWGYVVRQRGPTLFELSPQRVKPRTKGDSVCCYSGVRTAPVLREGQSQGFKLFHMDPESFVARLGLRDQDIVRSVNGMSLETPERALEVYTWLQNASRIELELERDGKLLRRTYLIKPGARR